MFKYAALALVALAGATPAFAQDADFTGFHIEGLAGYDSVDLGGASDGGVVFGVGAGYDFQTGSVVLGVEGEATFSTVKDCVTFLGSEFCDEAGRDLYAGVRIGVPVGTGTLIYIKGGYTNAKAKATIDGTTVGSDTGDGIRGGLGVEHQFGSNIFVKAEYRYSNYEADIERHQALFGLGFRF